MTRAEAETCIDGLVSDLNRHQTEYYLGRPTISDGEFDRLFDRLKELESRFPELVRPDSPTHRVGSDLSQNFPEVEHSIPVLSLDKSYSSQEIDEWVSKTQRNAGEPLSFMLEEKIDGAAIVLYYEDGLLARAVTRGNGLVGNDITGNVRTIATVPLKLSEQLSLAVRGEIFLPKQLFAEINSRMEVLYANPRNLAAGTLRRIKSSEVAEVPLEIFVYEGFFSKGYSMHFDVLTELRRVGFRLNPNIGFFSSCIDPAPLRKLHPGWFFGSPEDLESFIGKARARRDELPYEIDGLVLKVNEISVRETLGYTGHHPRWAMAYKFESPVGRTVVNRIEVQIGRTGRATPVARIEPVVIAGSRISNATLHNQEYIDLLELALGDTVEVSKRGDVIPAIERVLEKNDEGRTIWQMPSVCPTCGSDLKRVGAHHFCINTTCIDQVRGRRYFFAARGQMAIDNLGPETINALLKKGLVRDVPDIYTFDSGRLIDEPGFGPKKIELIAEGIRKSRTRPYKTVLAALGIPDLGQKATELLVEAGFTNIDALLDVAGDEVAEPLTSIKGIGEKMARTIIHELRQPQTRRRIELLREAGLNFSQGEEAGKGHPPVFAGQTWCVTGSFDSFKPRELAKEEIMRRGGRVTSSITSKTTHLLAGVGAGAKLLKAQSLGVSIVDEAAFLTLLKGKGA